MIVYSYLTISDILESKIGICKQDDKELRRFNKGRHLELKMDCRDKYSSEDG